MARAETLKLLAEVIDELQPLGEMTPGRPLRAAEWNNLVEALRTVAEVAVSREATTDEFLDDRYARRNHDHTGQISLNWFEPATRVLVEESISGAVDQRAELKAARGEIADLRKTVEELRRQLTDLRNALDGLRDADSAREREIGRVGLRVEAFRNVEARVSGLDQRLGTISTDLRAALDFRRELVDESGQPLNLRGFGTRIAELEQLRDNLRTASGDMVRIREIESAIARLEQRQLDRATLDEVITGRLRDPALIAQSGLIETVRGQVEAAVGTRLNTVDQSVARLTQESNQTRTSLTALESRIGQHDTRLTAAEAVAGTLSALSGRLEQQQQRLTEFESRLQITQFAVGELPALRAQLGELQTAVADLPSVRTQLGQFDARLRTAEGNAGTINTLVTTTQQTGTRVSAIEQALPGLRQAADIVGQHATVIAQLDTRLRANEAELDNAGDLPARFETITRQLRDFSEFQRTTTQRLDDLSRRTGNFENVTTRLTAVENVAAEQRNSLARLSETMTGLASEVQTVAGAVRGLPSATVLNTALRSFENRLNNLERR